MVAGSTASTSAATLERLQEPIMSRRSRAGMEIARLLSFGVGYSSTARASSSHASFHISPPRRNSSPLFHRNGSLRMPGHVAATEEEYCHHHQDPKTEVFTSTINNNNGQGQDEAASADSTLPQQAWKWASWAGTKTYDGLDFAGEVVADFLGLTRSKYQWIIDMQEREQEEKRLRRLEARQRRQLRLEQLLEQETRRLAELEIGNGNGDNQTSGEV